MTCKHGASRGTILHQLFRGGADLTVLELCGPFLAALRGQNLNSKCITPSGSGPEWAKNRQSPGGDDTPDPLPAPGEGGKNKTRKCVKHS